MAKENETVADIIAWLRKPIEGENAYLTLWRDEIADRLEAAHKREIDGPKKQVGNAAKLREAIDYLCERVADMDATFDPSEVECLRTALAAPPRNCDVGTAEEQEDRFRRYCNSRGTFCGDCPLYNNRRGECRFAWAQMPYEKGEAK